MESTDNASMDCEDHLKRNQHASSNEVQEVLTKKAPRLTRSLCRVCLGYDLPQRVAHAPSPVATILSAPRTTPEYLLGSLESIRSRKKCPFCSFVSRFMPSPPSLPYGTPVYVNSIATHQTSRRLMILTGFKSPRRAMESVHDRFIPSGVQPRISPAQICLFLQQCEKYHDHSLLDDSRLYNTPITITLVDVVESRLVTGSSRDRYFALSYVWGELSMFQATMTNKPLLEMPGSLNKFAKEIPKLIQDAISFVLAMGERYLWVDSLCIEQDNPSQKHDQISQMDGIYSQAVATIVALSSPSAASALPGVLVDNLAALASYESTHDLGSRAEAKLAASLEQIISESRYETRAWTFQERLLSKRCLLFTNTGVYFQCSEILTLVYNKGFTLRELNFNVLPECILSKNNFGSDWTSAFSGYARLVRDYSKRHLSYASDALNAFCGILELFKHRFEGDIISGLPVRVLDEALLWVPVNEDAQQLIRNDYFPSWSWAGWIQAVEYWSQPSFVFGSIYSTVNGKGVCEYAAKDTRQLKSAIAQFYISGQLVQRVIDGSTFNLDKASLSTFISPKDPGGSDDRASRRDILEFDALVVGIAEISTSQLRLLRRYCRYNKGHALPKVYETLFYKDEDVEAFKKKSMDLVLMSRDWLPLPDENNDALLNHASDQGYFVPNNLDVREWCLLNLMIITWDTEGVYAERAGLCVVHEDIWNLWNPASKHICLT